MIEVDFNGTKYEFIPHDVDLTEQAGKYCRATHIIKGFEEDIALLIEKKGTDISFFFGLMVDLGSIGMIHGFEDDYVNQEATELVFYAIQNDIIMWEEIG